MRLLVESTLVAAMAALLYLGTRSRHYSGDAIQFALLTETGGLGNLMPANHLLYPLVGAAFAWMWELFGWRGGALLPLQAFSILAGAGCVGCFYGLARHMTGQRRLAGWLALGFGASRGMWAYSTDAEVVTLSLLLSLIALWLLIATRDDLLARPSTMLILGLVIGVSVLTYQSGVFLVLGAWARYATLETSWRERLKGMALVGLVVLLITIPLYLLVGSEVYELRGWRAVLGWSLARARGGLYGRPSLRSLASGGYGWLKALVGYPGLGPEARTQQYLGQAGALERGLFVATYGATLLGVALGALAIMRRRAALRQRPGWTRVLLCWGVCYGLFALYWAPGDVQFWAPLLVPWWLFMGLALATPTGEPNAPCKREMRYLAVSALALMLINGATTALPSTRLRTNRPYWVAQTVASYTSPRDVMITSGADRLVVYLPYFARRRTVSLYHILRRAPDDRSQVWSELDELITQTQAQGGRVFVVGLSPGQEVWWDRLAAVGLSSSDLARWRMVPAWSVAGEEIRQIMP
ncbi:MAG: hypothetical protein JXA74_01985 [Anaerolineae bacterium]|nr:hypothetical protein [Anaerolineae bacterium]